MHLQLKRAKTQADLVTPPSVESDGSGRVQVIDPENGERLICTIPKVAHGSAVELGHVPLRSNRMRKRNDFIWVTVRDHVDCFSTHPHCHGQARRVKQKHENSTFLPVRKKHNHLRVNPLIALELSPVTASFWMAGGGTSSYIKAIIYSSNLSCE